MRYVNICLPTVEAVQKFVETISPLEGNFDLLSGGYVLDAKSLMGILSLDLTKPIELCVEKDTDEAMRAIERYIAEAPRGDAVFAKGGGEGLQSHA